MKKLHYIFIIAALLLGFAAQAAAQKVLVETPPPPSPAVTDFYGKLENGVYTNSVFGFSLTPPPKWQIIERALMTEIVEDSKGMFKGSSEYYNKILEDNFKAEKLIISFGKSPYGTPSNAALAVSSQKIPDNPATLEANMDVTRRSFLASELKPIVSKPKAISFGQVKAMSMDISFNKDGVVINQRLYICPHKGFYINLATTYIEEADLATLEAAIKTLKFK
jgi:hypothetical protein